MQQDNNPQVMPSEGFLEKSLEFIAEVVAQKRAVACILVGSLLLGLLLCWVLPRRYSSKTVIMTPAQTASLSALVQAEGLGMGALASAATSGLGLKDPNLIFIDILESRTISDAMIRRFNLQQLYGAKDLFDCRQKLAKHTMITAEKSSLLSITVSDANPGRAADMANTYIEFLRDQTKEMSAREDARHRAFFENQLNQQREALVKAERSLLLVEQNKGIVHPTGQAAAAIESSASLNAEVAAQQVEVQTLKAYSTETNPNVQVAEKQLAALQAQAAKLSQHGISNNFGDIGLKDIPDSGMDFIRAEREVQYQTALYSVLLKQYSSARLDELNDAYSIQVVDVAVPSERRSFPKFRIVMMVMFFVGIFASILWIYGKKWWAKKSAESLFVDRYAALKSAWHKK